MSPAPQPASDSGPPPSPTSTAINLTAYGLAAVAILVLTRSGAYPVWSAILCLVLIAGIVAAADVLVFKVQRRPSAGLGAARPFNLHRVLVKLLALYVTLALIALAYMLLLPLAPGRFTLVLALMPAVFTIVVLFAPVYVGLVDRRMSEPHDGYWHTGSLILGHLHGRDWQAVRTFALGWIIKGFFLPLMASAFFGVAASIYDALQGSVSGPVALFRLSFDVILFLDLAVATVGYIFTLRVLDTHIRSCNPFWYGWVVTLACYYPFWGILYPGLLGYSDGIDWHQWFEDVPALLIGWGVLILAAKIMWIWANVTFGLRFSNLTHRGILTNGPFRFTKHPSYIAKNTGWWLISLPFLSVQGWQEALPNCAALLFINAIYFARAKVEERHLMEDPTYVAYAAWIEQHGVFARARRLLLPGRTADATPRAQ